MASWNVHHLFGMLENLDLFPLLPWKNISGPVCWLVEHTLQPLFDLSFTLQMDQRRRQWGPWLEEVQLEFEMSTQNNWVRPLPVDITNINWIRLLQLWGAVSTNQKKKDPRNFGEKVLSWWNLGLFPLLQKDLRWHILIIFCRITWFLNV